MNQINFNNYNSNIHPKSLGKEHSEYENLKAVYTGYINKMDKSDFAASLTRCNIELNLLQDMYKTAVKENLSSEIDYIQKRHRILAEKFKRFGIELKELCAEK